MTDRNAAHTELAIRTRRAAARVAMVCGVVLIALSSASADVTIPDTPAGRIMSAWLEAFNSGDRARLDDYFKKYDPQKHADDFMGFRDRVGGFDLISVEKSEPNRVVFLLKERNSERRALAKFQVNDSDPPRVTSSVVHGIFDGAAVIGFDIDAATRVRVIDGAIAKLDEFYVFPDVAKKMAMAVRGRAKRGEYNSVTDGNEFAKQLTEHFRDVSHDRHLSVSFSPMRLPEDSSSPSPEAMARYREAMRDSNCAFEKVEHLSGNVGYVKFNGFADPEVCGSTAIAAMNFLANVDAIIFDIRQNGGGDPKMIALLCSYLFATPTHLNDLWTRKGDETQQFWTLPYVPGTRLPSIPVYVLTSHRTFSGAEEFSNNLKVLKRATIVGEVTGGGAHPVAGHRIDDRFTIGVPFARAINPVTKTDWEGVGVEPDVKVAADDALITAQALAAKEIANRRAPKPSS
jgi:Peptidase family S41/N-terminal domain of Peptidase_S41 in eukaryotic IRBP